jgi:signal transduction histidine kinase/CheY-like chemotaxis protein
MFIHLCGSTPDKTPGNENMLTPEEKQWVELNRNRPVFIATESYEDWMNFRDVKKKEEGYLGRLLNTINTKHGLDLRVLSGMPYREIYKKFSNGNIDGFYNCDDSLLAENFIHTDVLASIYIKCYSTDPSIDSLAKLENKTAGFIYNQPSYDAIMKYYPQLNIKKKFFISRYSLLQSFINRKVDVIFSTRDIFLDNINMYSFYLPLYERKYVITFSRTGDKEKLVSIINKTVRSCKENGILDSLKLKSKKTFLHYKIMSTLKFSESEKSWMKKNRGITIGIPDNFSPAAYCEKTGEMKGICSDILRELLDNVGISYSIYHGEKGNRWTDLVRDLSSGRFDILPFIVKTVSRQKNFYITKQYGYDDYIIISRLGSQQVINVHDLDGKKVAITEGEWVYEPLKNFFMNTVIISKKSIIDVLGSVYSGEADYALGSKCIVMNQKTKYLEKLKVAGTFESSLPISMGVSRNQPQLASILDKMMYLIDSKDYYNLYNTSSIKEKNYFQFVYVSMSLFLILGASGIYAHFMRREIAKRIDYEKRLQNTNEKLLDVISERDRAYREKNEFFANVSHDIRTPLNSIIGYSDLLSLHVTDENLKNYIRIMQMSGNVLLNIISDILDIAKLEEGKLFPENSFTCIHDVYRNLEGMFEIEAEQKNIRLIFESGDNLPGSIFIDGKRLSQVLINIISNAIKFTEIGYIKVRIDAFYNRNDTAEIMVTVEDTGIGIPEDFGDRIFKTFQQYMSTSVRNTGAGLGLAVSKKLVELMNGTLSYRSKKGQGTTFTIVFHDIRWSNNGVEHPDHKKLDLSKISFGGRKVLVADDVDTNITLLSALLKKLDCEVHTAVNGMEAVNITYAIKPELIIMDIWMPEMDGIEAARILKSNAETCDIPVIALTASVQKDLDRDHLIFFDDFLIKPVKLATVTESLMKYLKPIHEKITA